MLTWGQIKVKSRLIAITGGDDPIRGVHVAAKAKSILSMQKVRDLYKGIPNSYELYDSIHDRYELHHANSNVSPRHAAIRRSSPSAIIRINLIRRHWSVHSGNRERGA